MSILANGRSCKFAIKGQGHAPAAGFANIQDGVTIDLTALRSVSLSSNKQVAHVDAGASWLDVYSYLDQHNVTVAGGRNGQVGVGGLTLGGGISYIGPRVGWACDNVLNFEVCPIPATQGRPIDGQQIVLASSEIVQVSMASHPDLFRALKGGANNFGIVTGFDFQTFPQGKILAGYITSPFAQREAVFEAFADLANATVYDPYAEIVTAMSYSTETGWGSIVTVAAYTKAQIEPAAFQPFIDVLDTQNTLHLTPISTWSNETAITPTEQMFYTSTYGVSATLMSEMTKRWDMILNETGPIPGLTSWGFVFEPLPTIYTQFGEKNGGNSLGTTPKDGNAMILLLSLGWNDTDSDVLVMKTARRLLDGANEVARNMGLLHDFQYLNYAGPGQNPPASYGEFNLMKLRAASKKYDPRGMFQRQVPGGFKLWS